MKILAFDFDGVLADTEEMVRDILHELDIWPGEESFLRHHDGNVWAEPQIAFGDCKTNTYIRLYSDGIKNCRIFFHKRDLEALAKSYKLYIVSSNNEKAIKEFLKKNEISNLFSDIFGMHFHKSKVYKLEYILKNEYINPNELMMVGDTLGDIKEALSANTKVAFTGWGFHKKERVQRCLEERYINQVYFFESKDDFVKSLT